MSDLDRRMAIEVMGEEEPPNPTGRDWDRTSLGGNWTWGTPYWNEWGPFSHEWTPIPFSSSLEEALRAVDKWFVDYAIYEKSLRTEYHPGKQQPWYAWMATVRASRGFWGHTLPEAICNLLLALKEHK